MPSGVYERQEKPKPPKPPCEIAGCERQSRSRSLRICNTHHHRMIRTGTYDRLPGVVAKTKPPLKGRLWSDERRRRKSVQLGSIAERLMARVEYDTNGGCWLWNNPGAGGYGLMKVDGKFVGVHRLALECFVGPIPEGMQACHKCDVRACIRPDHLWAGTPSQNAQDAIAKGRWTQGQQAAERYRLLREEVPKTPRRAMTVKRRRECLARFDGICAYPGCDVKIGLEVDHVICLGLGGPDEDHNLEPLCGPHHRQKTDRDIRMIAKAQRQAGNKGQTARREKRGGSSIKSAGFQKGGPKRKIPSRPFGR